MLFLRRVEISYYMSLFKIFIFHDLSFISYLSYISLKSNYLFSELWPVINIYSYPWDSLQTKNKIYSYFINILLSSDIFLRKIKENLGKVPWKFPGTNTKFSWCFLIHLVYRYSSSILRDNKHPISSFQFINSFLRILKWKYMNNSSFVEYCL